MSLLKCISYTSKINKLKVREKKKMIQIQQCKEQDFVLTFQIKKLATTSTTIAYALHIQIIKTSIISLSSTFIHQTRTFVLKKKKPEKKKPWSKGLHLNYVPIKLCHLTAESILSPNSLTYQEGHSITINV